MIMRKITLLIFALCLLIAQFAKGQGFVETQSLNKTFEPPEIISEDLFGFNVEIEGDFMLVGAHGKNQDTLLNFANDRTGIVYAYRKSASGNWDYIQSFRPNDIENGDQFGTSLDIHGEYAIISSYGQNKDENGQNPIGNRTGACYIFKRNGNGFWTEQQKIVASDRANNDGFGVSVSMHGDYAVVGANFENEDENGNNFVSLAGSAYIFKKQTNETWTQVQKIVASDRAVLSGTGGTFGESVSIAGDYLIVGASSEKNDENDQNDLFSAGAAYVFEKNNSDQWTEVQKIVAPDRNPFGAFGIEVAITTNGYAGVCAEEGNISNSTFGTGYIFERDVNGVWNFNTQLLPNVPPSGVDPISFGNGFCTSIDFDGNLVAVGAKGDSYEEDLFTETRKKGSAYLFERNSSTNNWDFSQRLSPNVAGEESEVGESISLDGNNLAIGAYNFSAGNVIVYSTCESKATNLSNSICQGDSLLFDGNYLKVAGVYNATFSLGNGCDSTVTLNLAVNQPDNISASASICEGDSLLFDGIYLKTAGVFNATFQNISGCDSVVSLTLAVNQPDNVQLGTVAICEGGSYQFGNQTITSAGNYQLDLQNRFGCDSTVQVSVSINPTSFTALDDAPVCEGDTLFFGSNEITTDGIYYDTLQNQFGCDSVLALSIFTLQQDFTVLDDALLCAGDSIEFFGRFLVDGGVYEEVLTNQAGCDSVVSISVSIISKSFTNLGTAEICEGDSVEFQGEFVKLAGEYEQILTNLEGCDSVITLTVSVLPKIQTEISQSICEGDSLFFEGQFYKNAGEYEFTYSAFNGCDSVVTLNLTLRNRSETTLTETICAGDSILFDGVYLKTAGEYTATFTNVEDCDSVVSLNLTVNELPSAEVIPNGGVLTADLSGATYRWFNCDANEFVDGETNQAFVPTEIGNYSLEISQNGCLNTSACVSITVLGKEDELFSKQVSVFPNPTENQFRIDLGESFRKTSVQIISLQGKILLESTQSNQRELKMSLESLPSGMYAVKIVANGKTAYKRIMKQ